MPQVGGVRSGAAAPPKKSSLKSSKGSWGFSSKVVVSRPVCGSGSTLPGELDDDARLRRRRRRCRSPAASRRGCRGAWRGRPSPAAGGRAAACRLRPCRSWRRRGRRPGCRWPTPRAAGRCPIWAGEQAPRPLAPEGLSTSPSGRVTTAPSQVRGGAASRSCSAWGMWMSTSEARRRVGDVGRRPRLQARVEVERVAAAHRDRVAGGIGGRRCRRDEVAALLPGVALLASRPAPRKRSAS